MLSKGAAGKFKATWQLSVSKKTVLSDEGKKIDDKNKCNLKKFCGYRSLA